jgi:hypothetical protein
VQMQRECRHREEITERGRPRAQQYDREWSALPSGSACSRLLVVGALALLAALLFALRDGTLTRRAGGRAVRNFLLGFGVASVLWLAGLVARLTALQWFVDHAHFLAAAGLLLSILVVAVANARRVERKQSRDASRLRQSMDAVGELASVIRRHDRHIWIARIMLLVAAGSAVLMFFHLITLFWLEIAVAALFMAFWTAQTLEVE